MRKGWCPTWPFRDVPPPLSLECPSKWLQASWRARGRPSLLGSCWGPHLPVLFHRHSCLQQIVPAASIFQESVEAFQDWLSLTEQKLAQLWGAPGSLARSQDAHQQIQAGCREGFKEAQGRRRRMGSALSDGREALLFDQGTGRTSRTPGVTWALAFLQDLRREVQSKPAELEEALKHGWRLLQMVPGKWQRQAPAGGSVQPPGWGP